MEDSASAADLSRIVEMGRRSWPDVAFSPEDLARELAASGGCGRDRLDAVTHPADLYLACACAARARGALEAFERAHTSRVGAYLAGMRASRAFVDEVQQVLREKLFVGKGGATPKIAEYDGRGALGNWVRVIAVRAAIDLRRRESAAEAPARAGDSQPVTTDVEVDHLKRRYKRAFDDALARSVAALAPEHREILRLHFVDGLTLEQLAAKFSVHRATIARRVAAARRATMDEARRLLKTSTGSSDSELEGIRVLLLSQIDVSLPRLLSGG
jgi:RNA polymerase sigma-70 factor (ECF subfamily)